MITTSLKIKRDRRNAKVVFPLYIGQPAQIDNWDGTTLITSKVVAVPVCTMEYTVIETENSIYRVGTPPV